MDVVLEVWDGLIGDRLFAALLPLPPVRPLHSANASSILLEQVSARAITYAPASAYAQLHFPPTDTTAMSVWMRDNLVRQALSFFLIVWIFGLVIYFALASFSYVFIFDKATFKHPKFLAHQIRQEIACTMRAMPVMSLLTVPFFLLELHGHARMYDRPEDAPFGWYNVLQFPLFIMFTDFCIYWIHRWLHSRLVYKHLHKPHHKWIMPSPYASHAFHPVDGWAQSLPYHIFPFIFPLNKYAYILLFGFVNVWTVLIHDGEYVSKSPVINGAACHTIHHLYFNYNYGQFTTLWDRLGRSYRKPDLELFSRETKSGAKEWEREVREMETIVRLVEGDDDRDYANKKRE